MTVLLEAGADINAPDSALLTALHFAAAQDKHHAVKFALQSGADW